VQAYLNLIQQLLNCPQGEEGKILQAKQWLSNLSRQLVARLGNPSTSSTPEAYFNFLMETLQKISGSSVCVMQWTEVIRDGTLIEKGI
jgi:hypothetical protein